MATLSVLLKHGTNKKLIVYLSVSSEALRGTSIRRRKLVEASIFCELSATRSRNEVPNDGKGSPCIC